MAVLHFIPTALSTDTKILCCTVLQCVVSAVHTARVRPGILHGMVHGTQLPVCSVTWQIWHGLKKQQQHAHKNWNRPLPNQAFSGFKLFRQYCWWTRPHTHRYKKNPHKMLAHRHTAFYRHEYSVLQQNLANESHLLPFQRTTFFFFFSKEALEIKFHDFTHPAHVV